MIAIVVTLAISTFLLGVAALAVDLGQAYLRQNDLQSLADRLALAGARGLPVITEPEGALDQVTTTLTSICASGEESGEVCSVTADQWTDGDESNGEITFFADSDRDGQVSPSDAVSDLSTASQALRVLLPPATVQFGLAGALGFGSASIQRAASARIGTPLGSGLLPFALTSTNQGTFCVTDSPTSSPSSSPSSSPTSTPTGTPGSYGTTTSPVRLVLNSGFADGVPVTGADASLSLTSSRWGSLRDVTFHQRTSGSESAPVTSRTGWRTYRVTVPAGSPGTTVEIWATGRQGRSPSTAFTTTPITLTYAGTAATPGAGACTDPLLTVPSGASLEETLRTGATLATDCATASAICLTGNLTAASGLSQALTSGLLTGDGNRPGRLIGDTGNGTYTVGSYDGIDATDLFGSPHLTDERYSGGQSLKAALSSGRAATPAERGWITAAAVRSHRLAVVPVVDPTETPAIVTSFRYVWIGTDSADRGLLWESGTLTGFEGYVIDPGYLPATVSGSGTVGPYLGSAMPKEALLTPDLGGSAG
ncbi:hypothetical protein JCM9957A_09770 [Kineosporia succinea]